MDNATITFPLLGDWATFNFSRYFTVFGFKIYWYGVIIALGFLLAAIYIIKRSKYFGITEDNVLEALICAIPIAVIFARLFFVVFSTDSDGYNKYYENPIEILYIRDGGLAVYGGVIGGVLAAYIYSRVKKLKFGLLVDAGGLGLLIGQAIGRWGNFTNREAYGYETDVPWKMGLTLKGETIYVHPTFLYESLWNALGFLLLHIYSVKRERKYSGQLFVMYLGWYGFGRFFIEGMRTDSLYFLGTSIRTSQMLALLCVVGSVVIHIILLKKSSRKNEAAAQGDIREGTEDN